MAYLAFICNGRIILFKIILIEGSKTYRLDIFMNKLIDANVSNILRLAPRLPSYGYPVIKILCNSSMCDCVITEDFISVVKIILKLYIVL